jgi:hypothetical protein
VTDRLVSFVDFGPTVLSLSEVEIPDYMQGEPFLGKAETKPREYVFGHRDRVDEVIDMSRSVRTKRYLYIRNYMPHLGWNQPSAWPDQGEIRHEFYRLAKRENMTDAQWQFAGPTRPVIELYDCQEDPHQLHNLADSAEHHKILLAHAVDVAAFAFRNTDWGVIPEIEAWQRSRESPLWSIAEKAKADFDSPTGGAVMAAAAVGTDGIVDVNEQLTSDDASVRYWGAIGFTPLEVQSDASKRNLIETLDDSSAAVRIAAADALARHGEIEKALPTLIELVADEDLTTVLYAARAIELLGDDAKAATGAMEKALARAEKIRPPDTPATVVTSGDQDLAMFIGFSTRAFLKKVKREEEQEGAKGAEGDEGKRGFDNQSESSRRRELVSVVRRSANPAPEGATVHSPVLQHGVSGRHQRTAERTAHHANGGSTRPHHPASDACDENNAIKEVTDSDWINLFDGKTLNGWSARAKGDVTAKDGEIQILSKGANLWLVHEGEFADFELIVEAKMPDDAYNSGIGFRCTGEGKPKGYQCEIDRAKSGMIYAIGSGWVWPKGNDEAAQFKTMAGDCFDNADWNKFRIRCEGDHIQIWINGTQTADVRDDRFAKGSIALQHHGKGGLHRFRNIKLRKLQ